MEQEASYFEWLLIRAGMRTDPTGYSELCRVLGTTPFLPMLAMDFNRAEDGKRYREDCYLETGIAGDPDGSPCSMLELLLSLAEKLRYESFGSVFEAQTGKWFEELIANLGLDVYDNQTVLATPNARCEIKQILNHVIYRRYKYSGEGGLFPLRRPPRDQRQTELIDQMYAYLDENYSVLG